MKLYTFPAAPNAARVRFYLNEKGLALDEVLVNFLKGEQKSATHLARNPTGLVPVLELDDGSFLTESLVIIEYLEELYPEPPMIGTDPLSRARTRAVERSLEMNVLLPVVRYVHAVNSPLGLPPKPAIAQIEAARLPVALARVDEGLAGREFVMGEAPCIADCTLLAALNFYRLGGMEIDTAHGNLCRWFDTYALRHLGG